MERHVQRLLNRVALLFAAVATASLLHLFHHASHSCFPLLSLQQPHPNHQTLTLSLAHFPSSSCAASSRRHLPPGASLSKLLASTSFIQRSSSLFSSVFIPLRRLGVLPRSSHALLLSAVPPLAVSALRQLNISDLTAVDLSELPPLVRRADPHNLPFFDGAFDFAFTTELATALFPARYASEMERTIRPLGTVALLIDRPIVDAVVPLFKRSTVLQITVITIDEIEKTLVVLRRDVEKNQSPP